jgi:phosphatidate cytidylyltransferase
VNPIYITFIALSACLIFAQVVVFFMGRSKPGKSMKEVKLRLKSWWIILVLISCALLFSLATGIALFAFISFLGFKEYLSLIPTRRSDRRVLFWAYLAIPIQYYLIWTRWYGLFIITVPVYFFLFLPFRALITGETKGFLISLATIQWGLMMTVFSMGQVAYLLVLDLKVPTQPWTGAGLVLFLILLTELNDVAQFLWGKSFGKHKIIPKISPNKTVEGFIGGVCTSVVISYFLAPFLTPISVRHSIFLGIALPILGFVGDISVSAVKRDLGVKDTGALLPGHGGILDRIDSLTYTAPIFFHFIRFFYT